MHFLFYISERRIQNNLYFVLYILQYKNYISNLYFIMYNPKYNFYIPDSAYKNVSKLCSLKLKMKRR